MAEFKVGDTAWYARSFPRLARETCPVCFGNRSVTVILGSGETVITPCDYCGKGFEGPRGFVEEYDHEPRAERVTVRELRVEEDASGRSVEYGVGAGEGTFWAKLGVDLFADEAGAAAAAAAKAAANAEAEEHRAAFRRRHAVKSATWAVGYHLREAKEHRRKQEWHEARAATLKARAKEPQT